LQQLCVASRVGFSAVAPEHLLPPHAGDGLVHVRRRVRVCSTLQVDVAFGFFFAHVDQPVHGVNPPLTAQQIVRVSELAPPQPDPPQ